VREASIMPRIPERQDAREQHSEGGGIMEHPRLQCEYGRSLCLGQHLCLAGACLNMRQLLGTRVDRSCSQSEVETCCDSRHMVLGLLFLNLWIEFMVMAMHTLLVTPRQHGLYLRK